MNVLVIGANGKVGKHIIKKLQESNHQPVAMVRDTEQVPYFEQLGVKTVLGDLEKDFSNAFYGVDGVIFAAGSGPNTGADKTIIIDQEGAIKSINYAKQFDIQRFMMLSSIKADQPEEVPEMKHYLFAKHRADEYLKSSGLNYTIVRPGGLTNEVGTGKVQMEQHIKEFGTIPREDVAATLVYLLSVPRAKNKSFDLVSGTTILGELLAY
ncbi:NAD(P)H-binding protein [Aquibacillus halophilus]|uniref:NAD(P)H-binding protein n=1 Tax=Aquibacillus halophilus TaxID=930132 RepID=A0A6A8DIR4_9BACI|nr:SDR family oxidoreductase [Aquibacillus halophilus]MRH43641.1 NAD(P)H-binding protein [Aquibacillus halophilus]